MKGQADLPVTMKDVESHHEVGRVCSVVVCRVL